jgi:hypothetical protein
VQVLWSELRLQDAGHVTSNLFGLRLYVYRKIDDCGYYT